MFEHTLPQMVRNSFENIKLKLAEKDGEFSLLQSPDINKLTLLILETPFSFRFSFTLDPSSLVMRQTSLSSG